MRAAGQLFSASHSHAHCPGAFLRRSMRRGAHQLFEQTPLNTHSSAEDMPFAASSSPIKASPLQIAEPLTPIMRDAEQSGPDGAATQPRRASPPSGAPSVSKQSRPRRGHSRTRSHSSDVGNEWAAQLRLTDHSSGRAGDPAQPRTILDGEARREGERRRRTAHYPSLYGYHGSVPQMRGQRLAEPLPALSGRSPEMNDETSRRVLPIYKAPEHGRASRSQVRRGL